MKRLISLVLLICGSGALSGFGACAGGVTIPGCRDGRGIVLIDNRTDHCISLRLVGPAGADSSSPVVRACPPSGDGTTHETTSVTTISVHANQEYDVILTDPDETAAPSATSVRVACSAPQTITLEDDSTHTPTLSGRINTNGWRDLPRLPDNVLDNLACLSASGRGTPQEQGLETFDGFGAAALAARIEQNRAYLEGFFEEHFPDAYAMAGSAITATEITSFPSGSRTAEYMDPRSGQTNTYEFISGYTYTVNPAFLPLNDRESSAGSYNLVRQHWYDVTDSSWHSTLVLMMSFQNIPFASNGMRVDEEHVAGTAEWNWASMRYNVLKPTGYPTFEYDLAFVPASCFEGWMQPRYRLQLNAGGRPGPGTDWADSRSPILTDCYLKEVLKNVRGTRDFLRRKLMDLSGNDELLFETTSDGGFVLNYNGLYECSRDVLGSY